MKKYFDLEKMNPRLRAQYTFGKLLEKNIDKNPLNQFEKWFKEAVKKRVPRANAAVLGTVLNRTPEARTVLLKGYDKRGFVFFSHYSSAKARAMRSNPKVSLLLFWPSLERQVIILGKAVKISREETCRYFTSRPRGSQVAVWASEQSKTIKNRTALEKRYRDAEKIFFGQDVPVPLDWGGYRVVPDQFEFWQGRQNRLNDRIRYRRKKGSRWRVERLQP